MSAAVDRLAATLAKHQIDFRPREWDHVHCSGCDWKAPAFTGTTGADHAAHVAAVIASSDDLAVIVSERGRACRSCKSAADARRYAAKAAAKAAEGVTSDGE